LFVNTIKDSSLNLLNVLEELIDLAELETNQVKLYESACSLCGLFSDLLSYGENLKLKRKKYNVSFQINNNIITDNLSILTDIKCLRKVLVILLDNAIKYTDNGFIDFGYVIRDDKNLLFYVIDSGSGIPEEYQDNVFIKSNSFENNSSVFHNGLGVGLTIAKGIINILGGDVWFNSRSSEGTSFFFSLPFKKHENYNEVKSIHRDSSINRSNRAAC
jgi:signal transduction histidine kinase